MNLNIKDNSKFRAVLEQHARELNARDSSGRRARILEALERIAAGTYGVCGECGGEINEERLEIIPEATHCVGCQRTREQIAESRFNTAAEALDG